MVLIHGAGGDHLFWPPEMRRLPDYRVITLDLPGHGKTEGPGCQSIQDYARDVAEFMDVASLSRAVFVGHAMGGAIALGHPLGATGAIRSATVVHALRRKNLKYGMVTMCVGTGQGAAGIFERV